MLGGIITVSVSLSSNQPHQFAHPFLFPCPLPPIYIDKG